MRKAIRNAGRPALADVKAAVLALEVRNVGGGGRTERAEFVASRARTERGREKARRGAGLRQTIAAAIGVKLTANGIKIAVNGNRLPPKQRTLPMAIGARRGWRHPVYGNRDVWVTQRGRPWFHPTLQKHAASFRRAIENVMDDIVKRIE